MRRVPVFYDPEVLRHDTGPYHPESARRLEAAVSALRMSGAVIGFPPNPERTLAAIGRVHAAHYVQRFGEACRTAPPGVEGAFSLFDSPDNPISTSSFDAAVRGTGLALAAADVVLAGRADAVFVAARPPGHHALADAAMGFCFFNTVGVVARDLLVSHGLSRVLIADFDVHHGNGTQHLFWEDERVAYVSVHRFPFYPGTGAAGEAGSGPGRGTTANVPLPAGSGDAAYAGGFVGALEHLAERFRPEFVLVSAGFDAHVNDPFGGMRVTTEGFGWMTRGLLEVADTYAGGRLVSYLEGGYDADALGASVVQHHRALLDEGGVGLSRVI
ncbi:MAG TPA: histone deacetylase [Thermoanaerobaculia bacterium]|nr:histone deacetylase [Thermoanaerobaculia bacterium]